MTEPTKEVTFIAEFVQFILSFLLIAGIGILYSYSFMLALGYYVGVGIYLAIETYMVFPGKVDGYCKDNDLDLQPNEIELLKKFFPAVCGLVWVVFPTLNILTRLGCIKEHSVTKQESE